MSEIVWKEPPAKAPGGTPRGKGRWQVVAKRLRERPGAWALVGEDVPMSAAHVLKKYGPEVTARGVKNKRAAELYARWPEVSDE